jgi:hypothetical protein
MVLQIAAILALVLALVVGIVANRWVRPFAKTEVQGVKLELLVAPMLTLTVLLLSFLLVQVFVSYVKVRTSAATEAGKVALEYDTFGYFDRRYAFPGQTALVCYARATVNLEWPDLEEQAVFTSDVDRWGEQLDPVFTRLAAERSDQPYGFLLSLDKDRLDARRLRVAEARPAVPVALGVLLLVVSAAAVGMIAAFTLPYVSRRIQIGALIALALALGAMQWAIAEIDEKFAGVIAVEPIYMRDVAERVTTKWTNSYPNASLPCDAEGRPI